MIARMVQNRIFGVLFAMEFTSHRANWQTACQSTVFSSSSKQGKNSGSDESKVPNAGKLPEYGHRARLTVRFLVNSARNPKTRVSTGVATIRTEKRRFQLHKPPVHPADCKG